MRIKTSLDLPLWAVLEEMSNSSNPGSPNYGAMINELSDFIASYFSYDAYYWRPEHVSSPAGVPIQIFFKFADVTPPYGLDLLEQLANRLAKPYTTKDWDHAAPIVAALYQEEADVVVSFTEELMDGDMGVSCEPYSRDSQDVIGTDWFALPSV